MKMGDDCELADVVLPTFQVNLNRDVTNWTTRLCLLNTLLFLPLHLSGEDEPNGRFLRVYRPDLVDKIK